MGLPAHHLLEFPAVCAKENWVRADVDRRSGPYVLVRSNWLSVLLFLEIVESFAAELKGCYETEYQEQRD
jgi:hypothetical protein